MGKTTTAPTAVIVAVKTMGTRGNGTRTEKTPVAFAPADHAKAVAEAHNEHYGKLNEKVTYEVGDLPNYADVDAFNAAIVEKAKDDIRAKAQSGKPLTVAEMKMLGIDTSGLEPTDAEETSETAAE